MKCSGILFFLLFFLFLFSRTRAANIPENTLKSVNIRENVDENSEVNIQQSPGQINGQEYIEELRKKGNTKYLYQ